jgi:hypothetical protein
MPAPRYFSQLVPGAASRDALPSLQPRPLLFRPGGPGAEVPPHLLPDAVMPAQESRREQPGVLDAELAIARTLPRAAITPTVQRETPTPKASPSAPMAQIRPRPDREFSNRVPASAFDAPPAIRTASATRHAARPIEQSSETAAQPGPRLPPPGPAPLTAPFVNPVPRPYRTDPVADAPAPSLRIGTLEVRVAAPKTSHQTPARHVPSPVRQPARQPPRGSAHARIARPFATFGFNQS